MENHKEDNERANPKINDNSRLMTALVDSAIYYMKRGVDYYTWAKIVVKEVGDERIKPYLHKAWREAKVEQGKPIPLLTKNHSGKFYFRLMKTMNVKKILFPFSNKNTSIEKYWWHRLFIVLFFIFIVYTFFFTMASLNRQELNAYSYCLSLGDSMKIYTGETNNFINANCDKSFPVHRLLNFGLALLSTILLWYLLQIIYYKILLYIVFGRNNN